MPDPEVTPEPTDAEVEASALTIPATAGTQKVVPLSSLIEERKAKQTLNTRVKELEAQAAQWEPVKRNLDAAAPMIEAMRRRPDLVQQAMSNTAPSTRDEQPADDKAAEQYAKDLELYDGQGRPDTARARRIIDANKKEIAAAVSAQVEPLRAGTAKDKAQAHRNWAHGFVGKGLITQAAYDTYIGSVPDGVLADPRSAQAALAMARGVSAGFEEKAKDDDDPEVVLTESPGRRQSTAQTQLSPSMLRVLSDRGKSAADFHKFEKDLAGVDVSRGVPLERK